MKSVLFPIFHLLILCQAERVPLLESAEIDDLLFTESSYYKLILIIETG